jgi:CRP/FNR family transcriptional regulator
LPIEPGPGPTLERALALYPVLAAVDPPLHELPATVFLRVPEGTVLFREQAPCPGFPIVLEGEVKVSRHAADGRSLELYRVSPGEICLVSSACLFRGTPLAARGVATRPTELILADPRTFERWLQSPSFRALVLGLYAERMAELTELIDAVAFQRLDQRLAAALLGHGPDIATTHQALAEDLGTAREIVSRLLRRFEREGWIACGREHIRILDAAALRRASGPG